MLARQRIDALMARFPKGFDLSLHRIRALLGKLGDPHLRIPPVIHVAGTNGKGSTIAFCRAILEAGGYTVHVHTSPHLVNWAERYRIGAPAGEGGGRYVSDDVFADAIDRVATANGDDPATVFELLTAVMFVLFSEQPADYCLVEVGLGGRFDATNIIDDPLVCAIAAIGLDHEMHLGDTPQKIAFEKAGIIKPGRPAVIGRQVEDVEDVFATIAAERHAPIRFSGRDFDCHEQAGRLVYQDEAGLLDMPLPRLPGRHQFDNAGLAIATLRTAGIRLGEDAFTRGVEQAVWPARLQLLPPGKLTEMAPPKCEIWLDGGHNPSAGKVLAQALADMDRRRPAPLVMIAGMLTTKEPRGFFEAFGGLSPQVITVPIVSSDAGFDPQELASIAASTGLQSLTAPSLTDAMRLAMAQAKEKPARILIAGSLYLAGEALAVNGTPPQ